jgi:hypothetical protein
MGEGEGGLGRRSRGGKGGGGAADDRRAARPELGSGGHGQRGQRTARLENRGGQAADRWAQMAQCGAAASDSILNRISNEFNFFQTLTDSKRTFHWRRF